MQEYLVAAKVLGIFRRSINLLVLERVLTLVTNEFGNGPFHIQVSNLPALSKIEIIKVGFTKTGFFCGSWFFHGDPSKIIWNPYINNKKFHTKFSNIKLIEKWFYEIQTKLQYVGILSTENKVKVLDFEDAVKSNHQLNITTAVKKLAGVGPGLTPSGDDFLVGAILALWLIGGHENLIQLIYENSMPYTTRLSQEFLYCAFMGATDEAWYQFMEALCEKDLLTLSIAFERVVNWGASSGLDRLAGFISIMLNLFNIG